MNQETTQTFVSASSQGFFLLTTLPHVIWESSMGQGIEKLALPKALFVYRNLHMAIARCRKIGAGLRCKALR